MKKLKYLALVVLLVPVAIVLTACGALAAPTGLTRADGNIRFNTVSGADAYQLRIISAGEEIRINIQLEENEGDTGAHIEGNTVEIGARGTDRITIEWAEFNAAVIAKVNLSPTHGGIDSDDRAAFLAGTWRVSVRTIEGVGSTSFRGSDWSNQISITYNDRNPLD